MAMKTPWSIIQERTSIYSHEYGMSWRGPLSQMTKNSLHRRYRKGVHGVKCYQASVHDEHYRLKVTQIN